MDERNKLRIKLWMRDAGKLVLFFLLVPPFGLLGYFLLFWLFKDSTPIYGEKDKAIQYLETMNRAQQSYFFETRSFTDSYAELGITPFKSKNYQLTIEPQSELVFTYAIPKKSFEEQNWLFFQEKNNHKPLNSYVAGIVNLKNYGFQGVLCVNHLPGKHKPKQPELIDNKLVCSQGTKEIE